MRAAAKQAAVSFVFTGPRHASAAGCEVGEVIVRMESPRRLSLLCLPSAGSSATMYLGWRRRLPDWIDLVPVELPGRGPRLSEAFIEDFDALVLRLSEEHEHRCHTRYAILGHSMGALVAHGIVQRWRRQSRPLPESFFVSASPAPAHRDPDYFAQRQSDEELIADLRKQGGTPAEVFESADMLRMTLDTLRADYRICASHRYRAEPPLSMPIHVFAGRQDPIPAERILAWRGETRGPFSVQWYEGGHFFIRQHEAALLAALLRLLSGAIAAPLTKRDETPFVI